MAKNTKTTSKVIVSLAAKTLQNLNATNIAKELAGSVLSQSNKER